MLKQKTMRKILIFALMFTAVVSFAQQDAQYTQYMYNTINVNPAYAGSRGALSIFGLHRAQWIGMDGAPVTNSFSVNTPINESKIGVGLSVVNDKIGPTVSNNISADISYTIQTSETWKLSFGIKASANMLDLNVSDLNPADQNDPQFQNYQKFTPNVGAGIYLHSDKAYVGLSIPNMIQTNNYNDEEVAIYKELMSYYLIAGYVFDINYNLKFKPALMTKLTSGAPLQIDLSANFMYNDKFVLGAAYRWDAAFSGMAGFQVYEGLFVGYAYDSDTTNLKNYNSGSHELFLRFELFNHLNKIVSPRFF